MHAITFMEYIKFYDLITLLLRRSTLFIICAYACTKLMFVYKITIRVKTDKVYYNCIIMNANHHECRNVTVGNGFSPIYVIPHLHASIFYSQSKFLSSRFKSQHSSFLLLHVFIYITLCIQYSLVQLYIIYFSYNNCGKSRINVFFSTLLEIRK